MKSKNAGWPNNFAGLVIKRKASVYQFFAKLCDMCMWCSHWAYFKPHRAKTHCSCFQILVDIQSSFDKNPGNHPFVAETPFNIEKYRPGAFFIFRLGFNAHVISVSSSTQKRSICSIHQTGEASREQATGKLQTNTGDCCGLPPSNKSATYWVKNEDMYKASEICRNWMNALDKHAHCWITMQEFVKYRHSFHTEIIDDSFQVYWNRYHP